MRRGLGALVLFVACGAPTSADIEREVFAKSCAFTSCHKGRGAGGLTLEANTLASLVNVKSVGNPEAVLVVPGAPDSSWLWRKLQANPTVGASMPPDAPVSAEQRELIRRWIEAGAK